MRLKDVAIRNAKARQKPYRINDGNGLYLLVHPNGGKYWQFRFQFHGNEKLLSLGVYPDVNLADARERRDDARKMLRTGKDPAQERQTAKVGERAKQQDQFKAIALEWHEKRASIWTRRHSAKVLKGLERDIFPNLGSRPIREIKATDLLMVLRKVEARVPHTAHRLQQMVGQIFRYAVATGRAERDVTGDLRGALQPVRKSNYSRLSANELPEFLQKLEAYDGEKQTQNAVNLLMLTFVRTGELRGARKSEFDLKKAEWRIPPERMKMRIEHVVPLSTQALEIFAAQFAISGTSEFVFPNRNRHTSFMSENTVLYAIYRMGYHTRTTAHGFRGTASTILHESGFSSDVIERQLAHRDRNSVRASYNHAAHLPERRRIMQWWADYLDNARVTRVS